MGGSMLIDPVFETKLEVVNGVTAVLVGLVFIYYGVTSRSIVKVAMEKWRK